MWAAYGLATACVAGVLLRHLYTSTFLILFIFGAVIVLLVVCNRISLSLFLCICMCTLAFVRTDHVVTNVDTHLDRYVEQEATFTGVVVSEPDVREHVTHYVIAVDGYRSRVRVTLRHFPQLMYGDKVRFTGTLTFPENFTSEQGLTFNYIGFLAKDGIRYTMFVPHVEKLGSGYGNKFFSLLFALKQWFVQELTQALKQLHGALAAGILLGTKQSLGQELLEAFRRAGLVHIVVLSGFNVTIIAEAIRRLFHRFPPTASLMLTVSAITAFAIMTGASTTTVRASVMAVLAVVALRSARTYNVDRALVAAGIGMVLHNPLILMYDPGFQLSFVATLGLLHGAPLVERVLGYVPEILGLRQIVATTIATQLAVLPLLVSMTGEVSVVSLVANVLVLPVVPFAMGASALLMVLGWGGYWVMPLTLLTKATLTWIVWVASVSASLPFAVLTLVR